MDTSSLTKLEKIYPLVVRKYEEYIDDIAPDINDDDVVSKMNSIITQLNRVGQANNSVVKQWNKVMEWVMEAGITEAVDAEINAMIDSGAFDQIVNESQAGWKQSVDEQLAEKVSQGESGAITWAMAAQDFREQITGGNTAVVGVDAVLEENLVDGAVTPKKTNFVVFKGTGKNLYNLNAEGVLKNTLLSATGTTSSNTSYEVTDYMAIPAGETFVISRSGGTKTTPRTIVYYDSNKTFVSGLDLPTYKNTVPTGASYVRVTYGNDSVNLQIEVGQNVTSYESYKEVFELDQSKVSIDIPESDITSIKSSTKNLYNPTASDISPNSLLNGDGTISSNSTYEVTGFMDVNEGDRISVSRNEDLTVNTSNIIRSHGWYDINKNWISGNGNIAAQPLTAPTGAKFLRITHNPEDKEYQVELGSKPTTYEPYVGKETVDTNKVALPPIPNYLTTIHNGKLVANGDSITAEESSYGVDLYGYPTRIADAYSMTLDNYAIGGSTVAVREATPTERTPLVTRYQNMSNDADLVIIAIGTNDWQYDWTPLGTMADRTNFTYYGALHNLCLGLMEKYLGKPIVFATPIKRSATPYTSATAVNANGKTLEEYGEIIKEVCGFYGIPVLDMFHECTLNPTITSQLNAYMPDGTHPNSDGHAIMARRWIGYLKQLM